MKEHQETNIQQTTANIGEPSTIQNQEQECSMPEKTAPDTTDMTEHQMPDVQEDVMSDGSETEKPEEEQMLLYEHRTVYDKKEYKLFYDAMEGKPVWTRRTMVIYTIILGLAVALSLLAHTPIWLLILIALAVIGFDFGSKYMIRWAQRRRGYRLGVPVWGAVYTIRLYETYAERELDDQHKEWFIYDRVMEIKETPSRFYLIIYANNVIIIEKQECEIPVQTALRELAEETKGQAATPSDTAIKNFLNY